MAGGIGSLLDVSRRSLFTQTQAIRVIGSNIANVNTPGYSRRAAEIITTQTQTLNDTSTVGSGAEINRIVRKVDEFLNGEFLTRLGEKARYETESELLTRAEAQFSVDNSRNSIGSQLGAFFSTLNDLKLNPSDTALRDGVILAGQSLTATIQTTYNQLGSLQREANTRLGNLVLEVNRFSDTIAELNQQIAGGETSVQQNLSLRDRRDEVLRDLSKLITVKTVETEEGMVHVSLENGFNVVTGGLSRHLEFTQSPSYAPLSGYPPGLDGGLMGHIVYNFGTSSSRSDIDLSTMLASGNGEISGLLNLRGLQQTTDTSPFQTSGALVDIASRVEAIARDLLTRFNRAYRGSDESPVGSPAVLNASSGDLDGNTPGVYGLFSANGATDLDADGDPDDLSNTVSFAAQIEFNVTDAREFAAAIDTNAAEGATSFAAGDARNIDNLLALRDDQVNYSVGNFSTSTTIDDLYHSTVARVGSLAASTETSALTAADRETQLRELQQSISGVSLDEEFANLINFQRAFEASARMIRVGDELLNDVLNLLN